MAFSVSRPWELTVGEGVRDIDQILLGQTSLFKEDMHSRINVFLGPGCGMQHHFVRRLGWSSSSNSVEHLEQVYGRLSSHCKHPRSHIHSRWFCGEHSIQLPGLKRPQWTIVHYLPARMRWTRQHVQLLANRLQWRGDLATVGPGKTSSSLLNASP